MRHYVTGTARQIQARKDMKAFLDVFGVQVRKHMDSILPKFWLDVTCLAQRIYKLSRELTGETLVKCCAMAAANWGQDVLKPEEIVTVVQDALYVRGVSLREHELAHIRESVAKRDEILKEAAIANRGEMMVEEVKVQDAECKMQNAKCKMQNAEEGQAGARKDDVKVQSAECKMQNAEEEQGGEQEEQKLSLTTAELRKRVEKFLAGKLEAGSSPEAVAGELVAAVASGNGKARKRRSYSRRAEQASLVDEAVAETPVESYGRKVAVRALRLGLAGMSRLAKLCVAERLLNHLSFDELCKRFELERKEVEAILSYARPKVKRYTSYFENSALWQDARPGLLAGAK